MPAWSAGINHDGMFPFPADRANWASVEPAPPVVAAPAGKPVMPDPMVVDGSTPAPAAAAAGAGVLPSTTIGSGMTGLPAGAATTGGAGSTLAQLARSAGNGNIPSWLIPALQAGMGGLSSGLAANAAGNANQQQLAAIQAAMAWQQKVYADQQAAAKPYQQLGQQGVQDLSNFQPFNVPFVPGQPRSNYAMPTTPAGPGMAPPTAGAPPPGGPAPSGGPGGMSLDMLAGLGGGSGLPRASMGPPPPLMAPPSGQPSGGMVLLRGPNGNTQQVPAEIAPRLIAMGAVRVG